jgi:hypothetical protein
MILTGCSEPIKSTNESDSISIVAKNITPNATIGIYRDRPGATFTTGFIVDSDGNGTGSIPDYKLSVDKANRDKKGDSHIQYWATIRWNTSSENYKPFRYERWYDGRGKKTWIIDN